MTANKPPMCEDCRWWTGRASDSTECRRSAPIVLTTRKELLYPRREWPTTMPTDWCGQWEEKR